MTAFETIYDVHCKTYAAMLHTGWHLLDTAECTLKGSALNLQAATVFFAFTFEAYLNHVGKEELNYWDEIDRISYSRKLKVLSKHLRFPIDTPPFRTISELFSLRNALNHGRTEKFRLKKSGSPPESRDEAFRLMPWEKLTTTTVCGYYENVRAAITTIDSVRPTPDPLLFNQGSRGYFVRACETPQNSK